MSLLPLSYYCQVAITHRLSRKIVWIFFFILQSFYFAQEILIDKYIPSDIVHHAFYMILLVVSMYCKCTELHHVILQWSAWPVVNPHRSLTTLPGQCCMCLDDIHLLNSAILKLISLLLMQNKMTVKLVLLIINDKKKRLVHYLQMAQWPGSCWFQKRTDK
jgi:hypothetical protein